MEYRFKTFLLLFLAIFARCSREKETVSGISYEAVNHRFKQSLEWNATRPDRVVNMPSDHYQVWTAADIHVGNIANLETFFQRAQTAGANASFLLGDISSGKQADFLRFYQQLPPPEQLPCFATVGNHDLLFDGWGQFYELMGASTYTVALQTPTAKDLFICLDTGNGALGEDQLEWLEQTLSKQRSLYRHCLLLTHYNLLRNRRTNSTVLLPEEARRLLSLCVEYRIDYVVSGHDHQRVELELGNTRLITLDALWDAVPRPSCLVLDLNDGELTYRWEDF